MGMHPTSTPNPPQISSSTSPSFYLVNFGLISPPSSCGGSPGMEVYNAPEHGHADAYLIENTDMNQQLSNTPVEQYEAIGAPEIVADQGLCYPAATNYGYICTGFESPSEWDDHHRIFGLDGQDMQYAGTQIESLPCVYYTPGYGYAQSPYNPYNPYIPGAMVGFDGPYVGAQQFYNIPSYENPVSSHDYFPIVIQSRPDILSDPTINPFMDTIAPVASRPDGHRLKHNLSSASPAFPPGPPSSASNQAHSFTRASEGHVANAGSSKQSSTHAPVTSGGFSMQASRQILQGKSSQAEDSVSHGKSLSIRNPLKVSLPPGNGFSNLGQNAQGSAIVDKVLPKLHHGRVMNNVVASPDALSEHNRGPRTNKSKNHLAVKAYITNIGETDAQRNIIIHTDQYNKDDFPVDHVSAKFFVIKSYSEDDVHKSIKYNVWSSTPNGNKKLNNAYKDARRIAASKPRGCPIFLFFSVNASGQFCGVAEMTGPVDFHKDMDFWQQDKWSGSFPVKWHIIKDVSNPHFRHIILENNENKPVTNSRDTQEIKYKKGMEMLKIFKNHASKTSLLDDFMYYENRQKIMQEEKAGLLIESYDSPFLVNILDPPRKLNSALDLPSGQDQMIGEHEVNSCQKDVTACTEQAYLDLDGGKLSTTDENVKGVADEVANDNLLRFGSLTISPKDAETKFLETAAPASVTLNTESVDVVTIGSVPVNVNGFAESSGFLTVGSIPLDIEL